MIPHILLAIALFSTSPSQPVTSQHATLPAAEAAVGWPVTHKFKNTSKARVRVRIDNIAEAWVNPGCSFTTRKRNVGDIPVFRVYDEAGNELDSCHGTPWGCTRTWNGSDLK